MRGTQTLRPSPAVAALLASLLVLLAYPAPVSGQPHGTPPGQDPSWTPPGQDQGAPPPGRDPDFTPPGLESDRSEQDWWEADWPQYASNPFSFDLHFPIPKEWPALATGSLFAHQLDDDGLLDFVVTASDKIAGYDHFGELLYQIDAPIHLPGPANGGQGYPGIQGPGAIAGDINGDGQAEVMYITKDGTLRIHNGLTGEDVASYSFPGGEALSIANFRGLGDRDAIVQYSQNEIRAIRLDTGETLWHAEDYSGIEHSPVRTADLDGDGLDEVVGPVILGPDGQRIHDWDLPRDQGTNLSGIDSLTVNDIVPGGLLEVAIAEQAAFPGVHTSGEVVVFNPDEILWGTRRAVDDIPDTGQCSREKDPDKVAVGDFDPARPGLETIARSACGNHPWVMDSTGQIISTWNVPETAPDDWYFFGEPCPELRTCDGDEGGIDVLTPINWDASGKDYLVVRERDVLNAKVAIIDALDGTFLKVFDTFAGRHYVADISGDYREEIVVVEAGGEGNGRIQVFWNDEPNPDPSAEPRKWSMQHYRRVKQNWNYYSPS